METFGVDATYITNRVANLSLDPNSQPYVAVDEIIESKAAQVLGEARVHGITTWEVGDITYKNLQTMVFCAAACEILASKDRGMDRVTYYQRQYDQIRAQLKANPSSVAPGSATDKRGVRVVADPELANIDRLGLARRLIY